MSNLSPESVGHYLAATAQRELDALRAQLDVRLSALEAALARPDPQTSLENLVLDLARVATAEAEAAAARASLEAQLHAQARAAVAASDVQRSLEEERDAAARLRQEYDEVRRALEAERLAHVAGAHELDRLQADLQGALDADVASRRQVEQMEHAVQNERARGATLDTQLVQHRADVARLTDALGSLQGELAGAQRAVGARAEDNVAARRQVEELEHALRNERAHGAMLESQLEQERDAAARRSEALAALQRELAGTQRAVEARAHDDDTHRIAVESLENRCAELDRDYSAAITRVEEVVRERDALAATLEAERQATAATRDAVDTRVAAIEAERASVEAERASAEQGWKDAEARVKKAGDERGALAATLEVAQMEAAAARAAADARSAAVDMERANAEQSLKDAEARAEEASAERDELARLLDLAKQTIEGMHTAVETRLGAIDAKRTRTMKAWEEAEARAESAIRDRNALAAELDAVRQAAPPDAEIAERLEAATERIRVLELQLFERDRGPRDRDVDLGSLIDEAPSPPSDQAGQRATRHGFKPTTKVQIDRDPGVLVDLSVTGAQVVSATSPEVGRIVTLTLPSDEAPCFCQGRLLWARREQTAKGRPYRYRAGIVFTAADEAAIEAFIKHHAVS